MGSYPNRSNGHTEKQQSVAGDTRTGRPSRIGEQADTRASSRDAHAIEPITMRVPDACRYIGVSRSTLYVLIAEGEIEIVKLGCSTLVLTESLKALIAKRRGPSDACFDQTGV
jgi:excisionase family DNA binding protein